MNMSFEVKRSAFHGEDLVEEELAKSLDILYGR
jgi:hypothetical protein